MRANDCRKAGEWLLKGTDLGLSAPEQAALASHLGVCAPCRRRAELLESAATRLRRRSAAPPGFSDRVLRRLSRAGEPQARPSLAGRVWLGAAAAVLVVASLTFATRDRGGDPAAAETQRVPVELELAAAEVQSVAVVGDFNGWNAANLRRGEDGVWRIRLSLAPGRYQYVFVVDDEKWIADPRAETVVDNGYSGTNSVLDVTL